MGKTTDQEASFVRSTLEALSRRPVRNKFDGPESTELHVLPAASRPFALTSSVSGSESGEATFAVTVKALKGATGPCAVAGLSAFDSVDALKTKAAKALNVDAANVRLVFKGKALAGQGKTLQDFGLSQGAVVHVMIVAGTASDEKKDKDPFNEAAASIGQNSLFWGNIERTVQAQFGGNKEHANKVCVANMHTLYRRIDSVV
ncbi:hypothetical protein BCR33DRAFT_713111 [Rhizoclosmatium globosum]|uniref:Ubiquitin-like domain-containing protein n=1 Tax=Rhizoclosmatium globosum TaxID=329046 RepID=A0A1Y2CTB7_9FUNG|nr:hypothetical protein BCR33DRAFT_713111 [Rhizoclosmatium globosum]|eukprot:ORY50279.1 hypothetical protein BCR33DRAFT_713111 [Rhizoclosmatium globosum]